MAKGILRKLRKARNKVNETIRKQTDQSNLYSHGFSSEGYLGGYRDALNDVELVLNGIKPNRQWTWDDFWG